MGFTCMKSDFISQHRGPLPVNYFLRIPNVGDLTCPAIVSAITGRRVKHSTQGSVPHLLAIGSIIGAATSQSLVWGTGVMHPSIGTGNAMAKNIYALRGRLSCAAIRAAGLMLRDVPFGDPGFLAPRLMGIERSMVPRFEVGIVCHYVDRSHPTLQRMMQESGVVDLNVHEPPEVFLRRMAECRHVVSSSLHGLIFAEALGIPNLWISAGGEIGGGTFKFDDWYSTTRRPQRERHDLKMTDTVWELARQAECRESTIDVGALLDAFPHDRLEEMALPDNRAALPTTQCRLHPLPVFLISFNRGKMLRKAIASLCHLSTPVEVVIHDNGSTDLETIAILNELESLGFKVFRYPAIFSPDQLNQVNETVDRYFSDWDEPARYAVSDCDIDLSIAAPTALKIYDELLNIFRKQECVGPMLRIRDIPRNYPLFNRVMNRHIKQFWSQKPDRIETSVGDVMFLQSRIDTTFAIHRAGEPFRRLKPGLRVYEPFEALHLDWYFNGENQDNVYMNSSSAEISHWNNSKELRAHHAARLEHSSFYAVRQTNAGTLEIYTETLESPMQTACPKSECLGE